MDLLLDTVKDVLTKIHTVKSATDSTGVLLEDWIRILNQTKFTSSVLKDPQWTGPEEENVDSEAYNQREADLQAELHEIEAENERLVSNLNSLQSTEDQLKRR